MDTSSWGGGSNFIAVTEYDYVKKTGRLINTRDSIAIKKEKLFGLTQQSTSLHLPTPPSDSTVSEDARIQPRTCDSYEITRKNKASHINLITLKWIIETDRKRWTYVNSDRLYAGT